MNAGFEHLEYLPKDSPLHEVYSREKYGGYNDAPPNWRELTEEEFAQGDFFRYSITGTEYRQFIFPDLDGREVYHGVTLFYMRSGGGFAIVNEYWKGKVRFFRFALCEHEYRSLTVEECRERGIYHAGMCYHVAECVKCGEIEAYDSSD